MDLTQDKTNIWMYCENFKVLEMSKFGPTSISAKKNAAGKKQKFS